MKLKIDVPIGKLEIWACEWEDAHYDGNEYGADEITHRPINYVSVGILLRDDDTGFATATDINESGAYRGINFVPARMIVRKWKVGALKPVNRKKKPLNDPVPDAAPPTEDTQ